MLNRFARLLLVTTALSPVAGAVAVNAVARGLPWTRWTPWLGCAALLVLLCGLMLRHAARAGQREELVVEAFERSDKEALAFLLAYLLPFIGRPELSFTGEPLTTAYVLGLILLSFAHAEAFHFNPVMGLLGYRFYAVKNRDGVPRLLIARRAQRRTGEPLPTVQLAPGIHLLVEEADA